MGPWSHSAPSAAPGDPWTGRLGSPWLRLIGAVVDLLLVVAASLAMGVGLGIVDLGEGDASVTVSNLALGAVIIVVWAIYETVLIGSIGATVGMLLFGFRVYSVKTGELAGASTAARRGIPAAVVYNLSVLGWGAILASIVMLFVDKRRQTLHDRFASTVVVRVARSGEGPVRDPGSGERP